MIPTNITRWKKIIYIDKFIFIGCFRLIYNYRISKKWILIFINRNKLFGFFFSKQFNIYCYVFRTYTILVLIKRADERVDELRLLYSNIFWITSFLLIMIPPPPMLSIDELFGGLVI